MKTLSEVINTLENYKAEAIAKAEAWRAVDIAKKKDGTEYQKIGQAVTGAKFGQYYPVEDAQHPYLTISTRTKTGKYITDSAPAFFYLDELPKDDERRAAYVPQLFRQTTPQTAEELRENIKERAEMWEEHAADYVEQIAKAKKAYNHYIKAIEAANKQLIIDTQTTRTAKNKYTQSTLYYEIKQLY